MSDLEFQAAHADGIGETWPLTEQETAPYYDKAERILQVQDAPDGLSEASGNHGEFTTARIHLQTAFAGKGCKLVHARVSHAASEPESRKPCIHCGGNSEECLRPVSSSDSTLAAALKTGLLTLWTQASVQNIITNSIGQAKGVAGIRWPDGETFEVMGRIIFLCASSLESTRILLNSASPVFPDGLGNSSGVLGRYLMDHVSGIVLTATLDGGEIPRRESSRAGMFYVPRWQNLGKQRDCAFLRGYGYQGFIMRASHELLPCGRTQESSGAHAGLSVGHGNSVLVRLAGFGEMLPCYDNYVEIDKEGRKDADGIPVLRIHCRYQENETTIAQEMVSSGLELLGAAGAKIKEVQNIPSEPGLAIHEAGTCRMGADPRTSVLNRFNQCHDVPNVFVTDASCFPGIGVQNPALTIMALTIRACEYAIRQLKRGDI
jgi:choline dehydrogenase-like flavoprotein